MSRHWFAFSRPSIVRHALLVKHVRLLVVFGLLIVLLPLPSNTGWATQSAQAATTFYLPWKGGDTWTTTTGNCDVNNHTCDNVFDRYAWDFVPPNGTDDGVVAVADGTVCYIQNNIPDTAVFPVSPGHAGNAIVIVHEGTCARNTSGTYSLYAHLMYNSATVSTGTKVTRGQKIARRGNSGASQGYHLHFSVGSKWGPSRGPDTSGKQWDTAYVISMAARFADGSVQGDGGVPKHGKSYKSDNYAQVVNPPLTYQGQFVSQSYQNTMTAGSTQTVQVQIKNTGTATWDAYTKIAPTPHDQASPFYDPATWESAARIRSAGNVAPGQVATFQFGLRAPNTPGQYTIGFAFVQEMVTWFAQPSDGAISFQINVQPATTAAYQGQFVSQSYQNTMTAGSTQTVQVQIKNTGTATWDAYTKIAPTPHDQASPFYDPATWESAARIRSAGNVAPGQVATFQFGLRAPNTPGQYTIGFAFV